MMFRGLSSLLLLAAGAACAQTDPVIEIHGVVTEIGLGLGLEGAQLTIYEFVGPDRERKVYSTLVTDPHGEFRFHPERYGDYWIEVRKEAYFATIPIEGVSGLVSSKAPSAETGTLVTVSAAHPSQEVRFAFMRPGELTGTVIDENDKAVPSILVEVTMAGMPTLSKASARTGPDGAFAIKMLMPGDYVVKASSTSTSGFKPPPKFTEEDLKVVDEGLQTVYWPDAPEERSSTPVRVSPGLRRPWGPSVCVRPRPIARGSRCGAVSRTTCRTSLWPVPSIAWGMQVTPFLRS
jgi:hypothetical protein